MNLNSVSFTPQVVEDVLNMIEWRRPTIEKTDDEILV